MADEDLILEPDPVLEPEGDPPAEVSAEDGINALKTQLDEQKRRTEEAEAAAAEQARRTQEAIRVAQEARTQKYDSDVALVANAIETLKGQQDLLESNLAAAAAAGDWGEHAKYHRQMADNAAKLAQLEAGKADLERRKDEPQIVEITDPVEKLAMGMNPRSAAWIRAHPEYARDPRLTQRMLAAHNLAVTDNIQPDTDEYFAAVEATLGIRKPQAQQQESVMSESAREVQPSPAPARRETPSNRATLSAAQREAAEISGVTPEEYARNLQALKKEGAIH